MFSSHPQCEMWNFTATKKQLSSQFANPSDVTTVLMVVGGDVVQKALAQTTGCLYTPVCFSFGWVTYAFMALVGIIGDGRLLPPPDCPVKVFNLRSRYCRDNRNWVIGRIVRDMEAYMSRTEPNTAGGIRISVWEAQENPNRHTKHSYNTIHALGLVVTILQLVIASIPLICYGDWGILFVTGVGTFLAIVAGALPQWRVEKLPNRQHSESNFALTTGNGSRDIMIVIGRGNCLDLEELCSQETPRNGTPWEKFGQEKLSSFAKPREGVGGFSIFHRTGTQIMNARTIWGLPSGFWLTLSICVVQSITWLIILIASAALCENAWFLISVGVLGMFQNAYLAAVERSPRHRNLPLQHVETIMTRKVMDGLMDLQVSYGFARPLVSEFFPGPLREEEAAWWNGDRELYDEIRLRYKSSRGVPRGLMPNFPNANRLSKPEGESYDIVRTNQDIERSPRVLARQALYGDGPVRPLSSLSTSVELGEDTVDGPVDFKQLRSRPISYQLSPLGTLDEKSVEKSRKSLPAISALIHEGFSSPGPSRSSTFQCGSIAEETMVSVFPEWMG
ncbi:hypothetical protein F4680DRAFT_410978 [Xylaria scruposa]|nr:hypothetical protein F4680DRAFT_410978 [Xylaria scruposa]